jgi:non-specific serine/threonine protein kinase
VLDPRARAECRWRLDAICEEIAAAERANDTGRLERARAERGAIEEWVARAFGVNGRPRRRDHPVERARKAVYNRIRSALAAIEAEHPALGRHLARSITTGTYCAYRPERAVAWRFD